jgi:hypothetical protein
VNGRLGLSTKVKFATRKRRAGDEPARSVDRHREAAWKSEVGRKVQELDGVRITIVIGIVRFRPLKGVARAACAADIRVDLCVVSSGVEWSEFGGGRDAKTKSSNFLMGAGADRARRKITPRSRTLRQCGRQPSTTLVGLPRRSNSSMNSNASCPKALADRGIVAPRPLSRPLWLS